MPITPTLPSPNIESLDAGLGLAESYQRSESVFRKLPLGSKITLCGKICASSLPQRLKPGWFRVLMATAKAVPLQNAKAAFAALPAFLDL